MVFIFIIQNNRTKPDFFFEIEEELNTSYWKCEMLLFDFCARDRTGEDRLGSTWLHLQPSYEIYMGT